ncbi:MAG: succinate dehydrogenase assembly factor 2 [Candidatus Tisiphia sp.]|uniref:succinate dehydrogenase assembly factor 2 n=2 Tax=unclassified Candidatus Tisiphia TaxID=2996318 RepID=UPI001E763615|nr:MAG: succinate dehydrogenase assembly factor 2 [Rickettsia endosymbiont of Cimex lectularius]
MIFFCKIINMDYLKKAFLTKKLLYQSKNRGCKETGLILGKFAEQFLANMDIDSLTDFALILNQNDIDIYDWITNKTTPPVHLKSKVMLQILNFDINRL